MVLSAFASHKPSRRRIHVNLKDGSDSNEAKGGDDDDDDADDSVPGLISDKRRVFEAASKALDSSRLVKFVPRVQGQVLRVY